MRTGPWNATEAPDGQLELTGARLGAVDLSGADLTDAELQFSSLGNRCGPKRAVERPLPLLDELPEKGRSHSRTIPWPT